MKLIYYNLFKAISKIDFDKQPEWKTIALMTVLILFNIGTLINFLVLDFENTFIGSFFQNKFKWLILCGIVFYILHLLYASKEKSEAIIKNYRDNYFYNSIYGKIITISYVLLSFITLYFSFGPD